LPLTLSPILLTVNPVSAKIGGGIHSLPFIGAIVCSVLDVSSTLKEPQQADKTTDNRIRTTLCALEVVVFDFRSVVISYHSRLTKLSRTWE